MAVEEFFYNGKAVYVISELDLSRPRRTGGRWRTQCPVHGSRDRDLSISPWHAQMNEDEARLAGWGHCKSINCGATVLVKEWNPSFARYITKRPIDACEPTIKLTAKDIEQAEEWQRQELAALTKLHPLMVKKLTHERAAAYLAQRGLAHMIDFLQGLGVGYIPAQEDWSTSPPDVVKKWCDRLVFPFTTSEGKRGFLGRTLRMWTPGMDENEHKHMLAAHNERMQEEHGKDDLYKYQIRRYEKTYRSGFFNLESAGQHQHLYITEGPLDAIPLLYEGLPNVVAVAGMTIDPVALPKNVLSVTLVYDADVQGHKALEKTSDALKAVIENLGRAGIKIAFCPAPDDGHGKDWSERYRTQGREGLNVILNPPEFVIEDSEDNASEACADCHTPITKEGREFFFVAVSEDEAICYCSECRDAQGQRKIAQESAIEEPQKRPMTIEERAREFAQEQAQAERELIRQAQEKRNQARQEKLKV